MKRGLLLLFILINYLSYSQLVWDVPITDANATISVGEGNGATAASDPTLNGAILPDGSLIGVFFLNDANEYTCAGATMWNASINQAVAAWGSESGQDNGFSVGEAYNWFVRVCEDNCWVDVDGDDVIDANEVSDGVDYISNDAVMVDLGGMFDLTYVGNGLSGLASADFIEFEEEEAEIYSCECTYGVAFDNSGVCFILNACSDPLASNYCPGPAGTTYLQEACEYDSAVEGCMCSEAVNYDDSASVDDGSCYIIEGGCSNSLASNYSGDDCANATFLEESCEFAGCICPVAYNYDPSASVDDGSCWVLTGGCSDPLANNYSGDECTLSNFVAEDCQYTPVDVDLVWDYDITDANMTIQIGADVVTFNGQAPPIGSLIGVFFTNDAGQLQNAGYLEWNGDQLALAAWASESGLDNGFAADESITWGLSIGGEDFLATSSIMNSTAPFSDIFVSNGFGQLLSAVFEGELSSILGCTDSEAYNYNSEATVDDGSCYSLEFDYTITDGNMTIQVSQSAIQFNSEEPPCGSLLGGFYTNDAGQLVCAGYQVWCDNFDNNQLAIPLFASESGFDNGFETGEEITWVLSVYGQNFVAENATMNPSPPFSTTFIANGFGQLLVGLFNGEIEGVIGCTNSVANNFNPDATIDDGSCEILGCTDELACNYDASALTDDASCYYETLWYYDEDGDGLGDDIELNQTACEPFGPFVDNYDDPCPGDSDNDSNGNGICDGSEILGCTNVNSTNFNYYANVDDGSCIIPGCTDPNALNYVAEATEDNGSCIAVVEGCLDEQAFNYNSEANVANDSCCYIAGCNDATALNYNSFACYNDGSCIETVLGCTNPSSFNYNSVANTDDGSCVDYVFGCLDTTACNYDSLVNTDNGSCQYPDQYYDCDGNCLIDIDGDNVCDELETFGCTDVLAFNYDLSATEDDGSCIDVVLGCLDSSAFNYDSIANTDAGNCCYISGCTDVSAFNYNASTCFDDGTCIEILLGCLDSSAYNYDSTANTDDGSCVDYVYGCLDVNSCNYDITANTDNGECQYPDQYYDCIGNCINDGDGDGVCDENEVGGCTNSAALNYNPQATDDDFCLFPGCLDEGACNYDSEGFYYELISCEYESCAGCTNPVANNYNPDATLDDGSCVVLGCTDLLACNYDDIATDENDSCLYIDGICESCENGEIIDNDIDNDQVCDNDEIPGCTDSNACNYNFLATDDDTSCQYPLEGYDCDGNELELDTPWGNNDGCDPFNNHTVAFSVDGLTVGDFIGLFYTNDNGGLVFAQAVEYVGDTFYFTVCGDDETTAEKDGFDIGESFIWQLWPVGEDCAYTIDVVYDEGQPSDGEYEVNGVSQVISFAGSALSASVSVTDALCNGDLGSAELTVNGGTAPYEMDDLSALSAGSYTTIVTDANGCSVSLDFEVLEPVLLEASVSVTNALCNGDLGSAELTVTGGTGTYLTDDLYSFTTSTFSSLSAGSYTTTVTDENGCSVTLDFAITEPEILEASVSVTNALCNGGFGSVESMVTGGTAPYSVNSFNFMMSPEPLNPNFLVAGAYTTIVTDANGCSVSLDFEITEPELLEASVSVTDALCNGDFGWFQVYETGGTSPIEVLTYDFTISPEPLDPNFLLAGSYTTIVTDANGCSVSLDFEVLEPEILEASVSVTNALCNGDLGSAELTVIGGTAPYEIEDLSELVAGSYTTMVIDLNGCESSVDFVITEPDPIEVVVSINDVSCNNGSDGSASVEITGGTGEYDYEIQTSAGYSDLDFTEWTFIDDLNDLSAGDYLITTIDENGCFDITEFSISEPEELSLIFDSSAGEYSNCNSGAASVFVEGGAAGYEYLWSNGATTSELTALCGGEYSVIVTDSNGCVIEGTVLVDYVIPDGWDVSETDLVHTIDIPIEAIMLLDQSDLIPGDYVGVFFDNEDGTQTCAGYVMLVGESTQLLAYGADGVNDGFNQGDQFNWKVWSSLTESTTSGFAVYDESYPDERYFNTVGQSGLIGSVYATSQLIPLNENPYSDWDMISTYMMSEESVQSIFAPVSEELIIVKDANGLVYWPDWDINTLPNLNTDDAYAVKTWAPNEIMVYGEFVQPEDILFNLSGWNYISYPRYFPEDVEVVLSSIEGNIKLLKDDSGNLYWPELGLNTIGDMEAGEGYILKVIDDQDFIFPSNSDGVDAVDGEVVAGRYGLDQPSYYTGVQNTNSSMAIGLPFDSWIDFDVQYGDELAVFDAQGNLVGVSILENGNNGLVVWADDESSQEKDGMYNGEEFIFQLWQESSNMLFDLEIEWKEGLDYYNTNGINIASIITVQQKTDNYLEYVSCYPNPNTGEFSLEFSLNFDDYISISIFNSIGEKVYVLNNQFMDKGVHNLPFSLQNLTQGLYYLELRSKDDYKNIIIDVTK